LLFWKRLASGYKDHEHLWNLSCGTKYLFPAFAICCKVISVASQARNLILIFQKGIDVQALKASNSDTSSECCTYHPSPSLHKAYNLPQPQPCAPTRRFYLALPWSPTQRQTRPPVSAKRSLKYRLYCNLRPILNHPHKSASAVKALAGTLGRSFREEETCTQRSIYKV
jgi:hypothetical protein